LFPAQQAVNGDPDSLALLLQDICLLDTDSSTSFFFSFYAQVSFLHRLTALFISFIKRAYPLASSSFKY
jgi:hypothetical protein